MAAALNMRGNPAGLRMKACWLQDDENERLNVEEAETEESDALHEAWV